ncbi:AAA family ATPase [bacterium]|mgnify:CR=1 FL=1|nr:AAA family ATPase [bacterium]
MASVTAQIVRPTGVRGTVAKSTTGRLIAHTTPIPKRTSIVPRASAEPDWKTKQREQDALISVEEDAVKTRVEELLAPILDSGSGTAGDATAPASGAPADLAGKIRAATSALESGLVERETEVRLLLLAAFCGEHLLLLGPPGTAKSELGRRLSAVCGDGGVFFERLLTRFSVPEELFGPLSMRGLENDQYVRQTDGYLPDATVAFVDEVFKANSAILNSLLTILNERLFDNGNERVEVPLLCLVGASNELPESEELDALYDRFLLRSCVEQVSSSALSGLLSMKAGELPGKASGSVNQMANNTNGNAMPLKVSDFQGVKAAAEAAVDVPQSVVDLIVDLRAHLQNKCEPPVYVSDRRLVKSVALLRVAAYTNGRASVSEFDCLLLANVLWQRPSEAQVVREWILERLAQDRGVDQVQYLLAGLFGRACRADGDKTECEALRAEAASLREVLSSQINQLAGTTSGSLPALREHLWLSPPDAERAAQTLGPLFSKVRRGLEKLLRECLTLEVALERATEPHVMALLLPDYWADFIRSGPIEDVKPLGVGGAGKP